MLIGLGLHARRAHYAAIERLHQRGLARVAVVVDLASAQGGVETYLSMRSMRPPHVCYVEETDSFGDVSDVLDRLCNQLNVRGVVVSTEPLAHKQYVSWALDRGLSILVDKPVVVREGMANDAHQARGLMLDFDEVLDVYTRSRNLRNDLVASVVAHRRYNAAFRLVRALIEDVYAATGCPVTSVTVEHTDGEFRMPWEVRDQAYHPFNAGYGVLCHSGYHALDTAVWIAQATDGTEHRPDAIEVLAHFVTAADYAAQVSRATLERVFGSSAIPDDAPTPEEFDATAAAYGEIDAHAIVKLQREGRTITTLGLHALHCSYSNRSWPTSADRNLYVGNGRVGQEIYSIQQGPFQSIKVLAFHAVPADDDHLYCVGGDRHCDVHVFRNRAFFPGSPTHQSYTLGELERLDEGALMIGPGKESLVTEFVEAVDGRLTRAELASDLADHRLAHHVLGAIYENWAERQSASPRARRPTILSI